MGAGYRESSSKQNDAAVVCRSAFGHFSNDPSLTTQQIATMLAWVKPAPWREIRTMRLRRRSGLKAGISQSRMSC